ncbi:MAG: hypothetical protein ACR2LL_10315, partial [Nitrosopumilus sp.]
MRNRRSDDYLGYVVIISFENNDLKKDYWYLAKAFILQSFSTPVGIQLSNKWVWVSLLIAKMISKMRGKVMINATA